MTPAIRYRTQTAPRIQGWFDGLVPMVESGVHQAATAAQKVIDGGEIDDVTPAPSPVLVVTPTPSPPSPPSTPTTPTTPTGPKNNGGGIPLAYVLGGGAVLAAGTLAVVTHYLTKPVRR